MALPILLAFGCLALLILEVFLVSFGTLSVVAIACGIGSVLLAFNEGSTFGWTMVGVLVVGAPFTLWGAFRVLPRLGFARGLYLERPVLSTEERGAAAPSRSNLMGAIGEAVSPLRPAGMAVFQGDPHQVVTRGTMIAPGTRVRVIEVEGNRIVVEEADAPSS
jgi:membrane-bound serine protease (ClpP class)